MKKIILAVALVSMTLVGCVQGPQKGYYDENGNYHPSQSAINADNGATAATVGLGVLAAGALAVGISAQHKANKADKKHNNDDHHRQDRYRYEQGRKNYPRGHHNNPVRYEPQHGHHRGW